MKIHQLLKGDDIFLNQPKMKKKEFLKGMVNKFSANLNLNDDQQKNLLTAILNRENTMSTGIGKGVAIPHCRIDLLPKTVMCVAIVPEGINFQSMDGKPVRFVFMTFSPNNQAKEYMQILAHLSRLLKSDEFKEKLIASKNQSEMLQIFKEVELDGEEEVKAEQHFLVGLALSDASFEKDAINAFVEVGIINASMVDATSVADKMLYAIPLFGSFGFGSRKEVFNKIIFGFTDNPTAARKLNSVLKKSGLDIMKPGAGTIFCIKLHQIFGGIPEDIEI